jgi:ribonuclease J
VNVAPRDLVVLCTGAQGESRSALSRLALGDHPHVKLDRGDLVVFSSRAIPGNERSQANLIDHLVRRGCRVISPETSAELIHATGHACQSEQRMMLDLVRPRSFVPIHGEYRMLVAHTRTADAAGVPRSLIAEDGDVIELREGEVAALSTERAASGRIYLDTRTSEGTGELALRDRQLLADSGMLVCLCVVDKKTGEVVRGPELLGKGVAGLDEQRLAQARAAALEALSELAPAQRTDAASVEEALRRGVRSAWKRNTEKRPFVLPVVVEM